MPRACRFAAQVGVRRPRPAATARCRAPAFSSRIQMSNTGGGDLPVGVEAAEDKAVRRQACLARGWRGRQRRGWRHWPGSSRAGARSSRCKMPAASSGSTSGIGDHDIMVNPRPWCRDRPDSSPAPAPAAGRRCRAAHPGYGRSGRRRCRFPAAAASAATSRSLSAAHIVEIGRTPSPAAPASGCRHRGRRTMAATSKRVAVMASRTVRPSAARWHGVEVRRQIGQADPVMAVAFALP